MTTHYIEDQPGGVSLVLADDSTPVFYPAHSTPAVRVELWKRDADKGVDAAQIVAEGKPGGALAFDLSLLTDRNLLFATVTYSASGTPSVSDLNHADWQPLDILLETTAPTLELIGSTTNTAAQIQVSGFTKFATQRKVRRSPNADMSGSTETISDYTGMTMPDVLVVTRTASPTAATIYVAVSHSAGGAFGPESLPLTITFADSGGAGGSTGGGGSPYPMDEH